MTKIKVWNNADKSDLCTYAVPRDKGPEYLASFLKRLRKQYKHVEVGK